MRRAAASARRRRRETIARWGLEALLCERPVPGTLAASCALTTCACGAQFCKCKTCSFCSGELPAGGAHLGAESGTHPGHSHMRPRALPTSQQPETIPPAAAAAAATAADADQGSLMHDASIPGATAVADAGTERSPAAKPPAAKQGGPGVGTLLIGLVIVLGVVRTAPQPCIHACTPLSAPSWPMHTRLRAMRCPCVGSSHQPRLHVPKHAMGVCLCQALNLLAIYRVGSQAVLVARTVGSSDTSGAIPGFGGEGRVRAEPSSRVERSSILRRGQDEDEDGPVVQPELVNAFEDVEKLERSLRAK
jgi:hypothetical protein